MLPSKSVLLTSELFENSLLFLQLHYRERRHSQVFTTGQKFFLNIVMMLMDLTERGGHALRGVTAHGSPGGPLQFDRLEAALAPAFH